MPAMPNTIIKHKGFMDFPLLVKTIRDWFIDEDYTFFETKHKYKKDQTGAEYEIEFKSRRNINEYVGYIFTIVLRAWAVRQVEIAKDGHKTKTYEGRVHIDIMPSYELDWQKRFGGNKFLQGLQDFYHKYIIYRDINDKWEDELLLKSVQLSRTIKETFGHEGT